MIKARPPYKFGLSRAQFFKEIGLPELPKQEAKPAKEEKIIVVEPVEEPQAQEIPEPVVESTVEPVIEEPVVEETSATSLEVLDISAKNIKLLEANNINTVEDLIAFEGDLEDLPKIGRAAKQAIMEGLNKWQNAQNQTTSTEDN